MIVKPLHAFLAAGVLFASFVGARALTSADSPQQVEGQPCEATRVGDLVTVDLSTCEVTPSTTTPPTSTSTTAPASTTTAAATTTSTSPTATTTTVAATTTTTTQPAVTTTSSAPATTSTTGPPASTTTVPAGTGASFSEDFANPNAFTTRFDHNWSGEAQAGSLFGAARNDWHGDHDAACGNPNLTHRIIHVSETPRDTEQAFYACLPGGSPASGHLMTTVNTEGYVIAWFSPRQTFTNTRRVCWDQNYTFMGNGKWTQVVFLTAAEAGSNPDLGFTSPEYPLGGATSPRGPAQFGVKINMADINGQSREVQMQTWQHGVAYAATWRPGDPTTTDKAPRYTLCVADNENGTVTLVRETVAGGNAPGAPVISTIVPGSIPNGPIRVVFEDDNYNPDKHFSNAGEIDANSGPGYTWHWDNILVEAD